ncbi:hypothetical protein [Entomohabitans teleogrylli]|nr:hypothetical protein [Entomohabitans teleogrylli]
MDLSGGSKPEGVDSMALFYAALALTPGYMYVSSRQRLFRRPASLLPLSV